MSITLQILLLAVGFILIAAVIYTLYSFIIGIGPVSFAKKFWHVTLLPEGILALLFFLLNLRGITATGHFAWWGIRIVLVVIQLFLLPKLLAPEGKKKILGVLCGLLPLLFQILDNLAVQLIL